MKRVRFAPKSFSLPAFLRALLIVVLVALFIGLAWSVVVSGYHYQFDIDEFFFSQNTYLYMTGHRPYLDVYTSVYPPVFSWITQPVFWLKGFTISAVYAARIFMIVLLVIRLFFAWKALSVIFSKRTAYIFLPLFLFDPFGVFTTMQYRPDNLMLALFAAGLYFFAAGTVKNDKNRIMMSGFLFGSSVLVLSKIAPALMVLGILFFAYSAAKRRFDRFAAFVLAGMIPIALFCLYLLTQGSFPAMIRQTFIDIRAMYTNFTYPIPINAMMKPDNAFVFGVMGKPVSWVYLWLIAPMGLMGAYQIFRSSVARRTVSAQELSRLILAFSFIAQWAVLFALQVAFLQHYMPFHMIAAALTASAFDGLLTDAKPNRLLYGAISAFLIVVFGFVAVKSIQYNYSRSSITGADTIARYEMRWRQIPPTEAVFPGFLFRPPTYPLPYGGFIVNLPPAVLSELPDIVTVLDTKKPRLLLDDYTLFRLPDAVQLYISDHYTRVPGDSELMVRKP